MVSVSIFNNQGLCKYTLMTKFSVNIFKLPTGHCKYTFITKFWAYILKLPRCVEVCSNYLVEWQNIIETKGCVDTF